MLEPILAHQPQSLVIANRTVEKAEQLAREFDELGPVVASGFAWLQEPVDVIINATSASLAGELPPIADSLVEAGRTVCYDMMYGKEPTPFCQWAAKLGAAKVLDGLGMLAEQAAEAFFIWRGYGRIRRLCWLNCAGNWLGADPSQDCTNPVGAGKPAKMPPRWMAPASPVFAGAPAPTGEIHMLEYQSLALTASRASPSALVVTPPTSLPAALDAASPRPWLRHRS